MGEVRRGRVAGRLPLDESSSAHSRFRQLVDHGVAPSHHVLRMALQTRHWSLAHHCSPGYHPSRGRIRWHGASTSRTGLYRSLAPTRTHLCDPCRHRCAVGSPCRCRIPWAWLAPPGAPTPLPEVRLQPQRQSLRHERRMPGVRLASRIEVSNRVLIMFVRLRWVWFVGRFWARWGIARVCVGQGTVRRMGH